MHNALTISLCFNAATTFDYLYASFGCLTVTSSQSLRSSLSPPLPSTKSVLYSGGGTSPALTHFSSEAASGTSASWLGWAEAAPAAAAVTSA